MNYKEMEINIFENGCHIEYEFINNLGVKIRVVKTLDNKCYRMVYTRNEHYVFVIHSIQEIKE